MVVTEIKTPMRALARFGERSGADYPGQNGDNDRERFGLSMRAETGRTPGA
jgi:hypothetical protein